MKCEPSQFTIDNVYPWGRCLDEYCRMFDLSEDDLRSRILSVADGPASFNAEMNRQGSRVLSCDPLYRFEPIEIRARVEATRDLMLEAVQRNAHRFLWDRIGSPAELGTLRMRAMEAFLSDFELGRSSGRYLDRSLPRLAFDENSFDVAVCSHFLFLYSEDFPLSFHVESIAEMARIAPDVRIFPLLDMRGDPSQHVEPAIQDLRARGLTVTTQKVDYEFQRGGNQMLRVTR